MATARQVLRVGRTKANGYRITVALVYDIKLGEFQRFHPSASQSQVGQWTDSGRRLPDWRQ
jgi:hypothetical protein